MNCSLCKYRSNLLGFEGEVGQAQISHHHHVEGCLENCPNCGVNPCACKLDKHSSLVDEIKPHSHEHFPYPHSDHPLGPVTLRSSKTNEI